MQEIRCPTCGKLLLEAVGEVKKICPKCKTVVHVVVTSQGTINLSTPK
jgi:phage FluMu protein Com